MCESKLSRQICHAVLKSLLCANEDVVIRYDRFGVLEITLIKLELWATGDHSRLIVRQFESHTSLDCPTEIEVVFQQSSAQRKYDSFIPRQIAPREDPIERFAHESQVSNVSADLLVKAVSQMARDHLQSLLRVCGFGNDRLHIFIGRIKVLGAPHLIDPTQHAILPE